MKEGRAGSTQASAAAHLGGAGNYNSRHASRRPPPSALLIGAESERVGWRGGSGRALRSSYWRELRLLSAFYIAGRPGGAWSADFPRELWRGARPRGRLRSWARLAVVPGRAAGRRSCSPSCRRAVRRPGDAGGSREPASVLCEALRQFFLGCGTECGLCGVVFSLLLQLWGVWTEREPWTEGVSGAGQS